MMTISLKPKKLNIENDENYISGETEVEDEFSNHTKTLWLDMSWIHRFFCFSCDKKISVDNKE